MPKRQSGNKKSKQSNFAKLSVFQPNKYKFKKSCPLSIKGAPEINYKNIKLLKKYIPYWQKKLNISDYGLLWISFIKGIFFGILIYHLLTN